MYECIKCKKKFKYESKLNEHKNRKIPCDASKKEYKCDVCKVQFKCPYDKNKHEQTNKHKFNIYNSTLTADSIQIGNHNSINNIQNIINLTLNTKTFANSNVGLVSNLSIEIVYGIFDNLINNKYYSDYNRTLELFKDAVILILDTLHFNISNTENHNLKILLMFPKIDKLIYEYLILEINKDTNELVWNSINYEQLLDEIFILLNNINAKNIEKHNNTANEKNLTFNKFIDFLKENLINNEENRVALKPAIELMLNNLYIQFNKNQQKGEREIKIDILEKINEYKEYRNAECRLSNGHSPNILNSQV